METTTAQQITTTRSNRDYIEAPALRALIKQNLGYNARQVTVSGGSSIRYLTVTVRDPAVDLQKVRQLAKSLDTWTMDVTDYCEGQSVNVKTTSEVDDAHGAPFVAEIAATVPTVPEGKGVTLSNGCVLWHSDGEFYVTRGTARGCYIRARDVLIMTDWAIKALALHMARVKE